MGTAGPPIKKAKASPFVGKRRRSLLRLQAPRTTMPVVTRMATNTPFDPKPHFVERITKGGMRAKKAMKCQGLP
jgi:hypothetical protein